MKNICSILIILLFISIGKLAQAQTSFCFTGVNAETFPMNPQSGQYNYFGVKVSITQTYTQNITVHGYIYDDGNYNTNHPFTLTITSGNLSAQTGDNFYQTDPTAVADVELSSVSPSTVTNGGVTFSTQCSINSPLDYLDSIGQIHNEFQDYVFSYLIAQDIDLTDTTNLKQIIQSKAETFFPSKGITYTDPSYITIANSGSNAYDFSTSGFSSQGATILNNLKSLEASYDPNNDASFFSSLYSLQSQSLNLSGSEVYTVGIPVTMAIYSFSYWKTHADSLLAIFDYQDSVRNSGQSFLLPSEFNSMSQSGTVRAGLSGPYCPLTYYDSRSIKRNCSVNLWKLGGADVAGAVRGGVAGVELGLGGIFAGAVLGSAAISSYNISNQIIGCFVSWWPF